LPFSKLADFFLFSKNQPSSSILKQGPEVAILVYRYCFLFASFPKILMFKERVLMKRLIKIEKTRNKGAEYLKFLRQKKPVSFD
jgi:hypothetical protein